jgi:hypothetical protein
MLEIFHWAAVQCILMDLGIIGPVLEAGKIRILFCYVGFSGNLALRSDL